VLPGTDFPGDVENWVPASTIFLHEPRFLELPAERRVELIAEWEALRRELADA